MTLLEHLVKRRAGFPLGYIRNWSERSFKFDAISILSILGAGEVDQAVGTLTKRRYTECLPLLAGQFIASNSFTSGLPGLTLYVLDVGMKRMELNESLARILMFIQTTQASTILGWKPVEHRVKSIALGMESIPVILSTFIVSPLIVCPILMKDWYGVCNACAIIVSILCRLHLVSQLRASRERKMWNAQDEGVCRSIIMRPDTRMITCMAPQRILYRLFESAEVKRPYIYKMTRRLAWVALSVHLCTLNI
jgi:hypothetical protein